MLELCESRTNATELIKKIWPGAKIVQVIPKVSGRTTRARVTLVARPGIELLRASRWEVEGNGRKGLIQAVVVKISGNTQIAGVCASPQTCEEVLEETL